MPGSQRARTLRKQGLRKIERTLCGKGGGGGGLRTFFFLNVHYPTQWRIQWRGPGGPAPPLFFDQMRPEGPKKILLDTAPPPSPPPPLSQRLNDHTPSPHLKVWISLCYATKQFPKQLLCGNKSSSPSSMLLPTNAQRIRLSLEDTTTLLAVVGGRKESQWLGCLEKSSLSVQFYQEFCPRL